MSNVVGQERSWRLLLVALQLAIAGCDDGPTEPQLVPAAPPDVREYVIGAARENLDSNGHFRLGQPADQGPHPIISAETAEAIALGVIRTWYANPDVQTLPGTSSLVEAAETGHGARVDWSAVKAGDRVPYFAESHVEPLPDSLGAPTIRHYGPAFLVPLYVGATPVVVVGVSAHATNVFLDSRGFIRRSANTVGGGEFSVRGVPLALDGVTVPPSPEIAVEFLFKETGVQVREVPVLGVPGNDVVRTHARWRVRLARPVTFERLVDGVTVETEDVYVGVFRSFADVTLDSGPQATLRMYVAAGSQPATQVVGINSVPLRSGYAVNLHEVKVLEVLAREVPLARIADRPGAPRD